MKFKLLFILLLLLPIALASEQYNTEELKIEYNQNLDKIPGLVKKIIGNEKINLHFTLLSGSEITIAIRTKKARIIEIGGIPYGKPTLNIYLTERTVERLKNKEITIEQAIKTKEITYKAKRFRTKIKSGLFKFGLRIKGWFT